MGKRDEGLTSFGTSMPSMGLTRCVPFITLSEYAPRAWVTLTGCNFDCRGCFSIAKKEVGTPMTVEALCSLVRTASEDRYGGGSLEEVLVTGGEPTLDPGYLLDLVRGLRGLADEVTVQSNAHLMTPALVDSLVGAGMTSLLVDVKAWDDERHRWYTGCSNREVLSNVRYASQRVRMVVNTLLMPGVVGPEDIESIARFLSECRPKDLEYRINPFRAELSPEPLSRTPGDDEMASAVDIARRSYERTNRSRSCLKETDGGRSKGWLTVFPDGRTEARGLQDYRKKNRELYSDLKDRK